MLQVGPAFLDEIEDDIELGFRSAELVEGPDVNLLRVEDTVCAQRME